MNVHKARLTMPAGLSKMNIQEEASSVGDVVGHLLCRGGRFLIDGSSKYCYVLLEEGSSPTLGPKKVTLENWLSLCPSYTGVRPDI